jgi:serine/threonine protein phosphatase PrpC
MSRRALQVTLGQHSRAGRGRTANQDFHGAMLPDEPQRSRKGVVVALADGIGSSAVSQLASAAAVRGFLDDYYATSDAWSVRRSAQRVLAATNSWLHARTLRGDGRFDVDRGHVCTFSALILKGCELHLLHVGDGRIQRLHAQSLEPLTQEHRVWTSPSRACLARALGAAPSVEIDYACWPAEVGEVYLLATDGAWPQLDAAAVHAALAHCGDDFDAAAAALADLAQARGSDDDVTVQLLRIDALPAADTWHAQLRRPHLGLPPPLAPRMSFDGYRVLRELHASARSHVHLAVDERDGAQVVLKTPAVDLRHDDDALDRFLLEEWVARRLSSAHVLKPCADERPRSHLYVAMEYVDGQTLKQWMTDHPLPALDAVRGLVTQIGRGLQAFHGKEMLHQDLRPENVMIDRHGTAKIIDFASTHVAGLTEGTSHARADAIVGTLQYTAPEYFVGAGGSARSDLYALAVLTYEMLTGRLPYGLHVAQLRAPADLKRLRYVPLRHRRPELPAWLDAVLRKALQPDPAQRQEAVSEFLHDLSAPGPAFLSVRAPALAERDPVRFWQFSTLLLALALLVILGLRATGR